MVRLGAHDDRQQVPGRSQYLVDQDRDADGRNGLGRGQQPRRTQTGHPLDRQQVVDDARTSYGDPPGGIRRLHPVLHHDIDALVVADGPHDDLPSCRRARSGARRSRRAGRGLRRSRSADRRVPGDPLETGEVGVAAGGATARAADPHRAVAVGRRHDVLAVGERVPGAVRRPGRERGSDLGEVAGDAVGRTVVPLDAGEDTHGASSDRRRNEIHAWENYMDASC